MTEMSMREAYGRALAEYGSQNPQVVALDVEEKLFSERQACMDCGVNIPTLEPRSFSFNSKYGACPECDGMGTRMYVNPEKLILNPGLPISELAFSTGNERIDKYLRESLLTVARNFGCADTTSFAKLPAKAREVYFNGSTEPITYYYGDYRYTAEFKGVGQWLENLCHDEDTNGMQEGASQVFSSRVCPACGGLRLRPESRAVKLNDMSISDLARLPIEETIRASLPQLSFTSV